MAKKYKVEKKSPVTEPSRTIPENQSSYINPRIASFLLPHHMFIGLSLFFGIFMLLTTPPFQVADEIAHFERVYKLSEFETLQKKQDSVSGDIIPLSFDSISNSFRYLCWQPNKKVRKHAIQDAFKIPFEKENAGFKNIDAGAYFYISYLPQLPSFWIGNLFYLNPLYILYLGRFLALIFYIFCVQYAIRIIPFGKYLLLTIALFPMCLAQAASFNADAVLFSFSFLAISLILKIAKQKEEFKFDKNNILLLGILTLFGVLKIVYLPIVLFVFLLPNSQFKNKLQYFGTITVVIALALLFGFTWQHFYNIPLGAPTNSLAASNKTAVLLENPLFLLDLLSNTFGVFKSLYFYSTIGLLGYLDTKLPMFVYSIFTLLVILLALFEFSPEKNLSKLQRFLLSGISISIFTGIIVAMYIVQSRPEAGLVAEGVQGRYFIPVLFPFFVAISGIIPFRINFSKNIVPAILLFLLIFILLFQTQSTLYHRYFGG